VDEKYDISEFSNFKQTRKAGVENFVPKEVWRPSPKKKKKEVIIRNG
jgi:hypothetical protein